MFTFGVLLCGVLSLTALVQGQGSSRPFSYRDRTRLNQMARMRQATRQQQPQPAPDGGDEAGQPQTWRDLLTQGNGVHDVEDFIRLLVTPEGRPVTDNDIFSPYETEDGKRVIMGGGLMATSDECSPRNVSVRLPLDYSDNQVAYYPECTMVQRCGGCTPTQFLSCQPLYKEKIVLKVLRARYLYPGSFSMQWEGFSSVEVERHLSCRAVCTLSPRDCGPGKRFIPYQCKCQCLRFQQCSNDQRWDDDTCSCRCQNPTPCCGAEEGSEEERTCSLYFDHDWCECTLKSSIGASPNASQAEIEAWLASRRSNGSSSNNNNGPNTGRYYIDASGHHRPRPITTTTTTTTTTTPAPSTRDPCGHMTCPRNFQRVLSGSRCFCRIVSSWRRYPMRG